MISDTSPEIEQLSLRLRRAMPADRRLDLVFDISALGQAFEVGMLRHRNPGAPWSQTRGLLARKRYWDEAPESVQWPEGEIPLGSRPPLLLVRTLEAMGIDYAIGGGIAIAAHGEPRLAADVDILARCNAGDLLGPLGSGFCAGGERSIFSKEEVLKIDFLPHDVGGFWESQLERKQWLRPGSMDGIALPVWSAEDSILAKLRWPKVEYWRDILSIVNVQLQHLDWSYLEEWAPRLGVADLLPKLPRYI